MDLEPIPKVTSKPPKETAGPEGSGERTFCLETSGVRQNQPESGADGEPGSKGSVKSLVSDSPLVLRAILWGFLAAFLIGAVLALIAPPTQPQTNAGTTSPSGRTVSNGDAIFGKSGSTGPADHNTVPARIDASSVSPTKVLLLVTMLGLTLPIGLWMMLAKGGTLQKRVAGGVLAGLSLLGAKEVSGSLIKDLKVDASFRAENPALNVNRGGPGGQQPMEHFGVGAELLGTIGPFPVGKATLSDEQAIADLNNVATKLSSSPVREQAVLVMVIGSADRQRLHGGLQSRFDSNVGRAQARAEWVRQALVKKSPEASQIRFLLLTSGPKQTQNATTDDDLKQDRRVEVWALWGGPTEVAKAAGK
jgi:hypothetical protein